MGLIGSLLGALYCGGAGYFLSPIAFLQRPAGWIEAVSQYRATHLQAPNFAFGLTARKFDSSNYYHASGTGEQEAQRTGELKNKRPLNLASVRHVINGAEPITERSVNAFMDKFCPFGLQVPTSDRPAGPIFPTYGLAEHTVFVCSGGTGRLTVRRRELEEENRVIVVAVDNDDITGPDGEGTTMRLLGCGVPARRGIDVRIVDPERRVQLEEDKVGEIWIDSPSKAAGYYGKEDVTREEFHATLEEADDTHVSFLRSGDLGFLHGGGELFICGRLKDLIITGGRNRYPQDLEGAAEACTVEMTRPGCSAAFSVAGRDDDGEDVVLLMELKEIPPKDKTEAVCSSIIESVRAEISKEHSLALSCLVLLQPRTVPKTTSGKISRSRARKAFLAGTLNEIHRRNFGSGEGGAVGNSATASSAGESSSNGNAIQPLSETGGESEAAGAISAGGRPPKRSPEEIIAMDRKDILRELRNAVSRIGNIDPATIDDSTAMYTILDSVSLAQLKGLLEGDYATKFSDEYLFRDTTTLRKLVEAVKLGHAADDGAEGGDNGGSSGANHSAPPGIVCCSCLCTIS